MDPIQSTLTRYILDQFLPGEHEANLTPQTPLISGGVLDSLATVRVVVFLEEQFGIVLEPHEAGIDYLDTIEKMADLVRSKLDAGSA
jgi:acyl carrier protein